MGSQLFSGACRLVMNPPASGAWNMAVDDVLLESAAAGSAPCMRFYFWTPATLSLGYFQSLDDRKGHAGSRECPLVRRASGGGAIVHDHELTYSLSLAPAEVKAVGRLELYRVMHETLIEALKRFDVSANLCDSPSEDSPFLCFQRRYENDVLVGDVKVAGSAQRRQGEAVLQHGSILLRRSTAAPELDSIEEAAGKVLPTGAVIEAWLNVLARRLELGWKERPLSKEETTRVEAIMEEKYGNEAWNEAR